MDERTVPLPLLIKELQRRILALAGQRSCKVCVPVGGEKWFDGNHEVDASVARIPSDNSISSLKSLPIDEPFMLMALSETPPSDTGRVTNTAVRTQFATAFAPHILILSHQSLPRKIPGQARSS